MNEEQVKSEIHTEAVLKAFEKATLSKLPKHVKEDYDAQNSQYTQVSQYTAQQYAEGEAKGRTEGRAEGRTEARLDAARVMKQHSKLSDQAIATHLQLDLSQVSGIKIAKRL